MTFHAPRWSRVPVVVLAVLVTLLVETGCATGTSAAVPSPSVTAGWDSPTPPTEIGPTSGPTRLTLADYLARIPTFSLRPLPVAVTLPHGEGLAAWTSRIPTTQPVAFLTIDDGVVRTPEAIELFRAAHIPVTLFLTTNTIKSDTTYFDRLRSVGAVIEAHTVSHPKLTTLPYAQQKYELCHSTDLLEQWYGRRPVLFRPPYGEKNEDTLRAARECGLTAGFAWTQTVNAGKVRYQTAIHQIRAGDIILMHFRATFADDFIAALQAIKMAGLTPALLEDYVAPTPSP